MKRKGFISIVCALLCVVFASALVGCGGESASEGDYANFVKMQARYETEKELVGLLREYHEKYTAFMTESTDLSDGEKNYAAKDFADTQIAFVTEDGTIISDYELTSMRVEANYCQIYLDSKTLQSSPDFVKIENDTKTKLSDYVGVNRPPYGQSTWFFNYHIPEPSDILLLKAKVMELDLQNAAKAYNKKRSDYKTATNYLPKILSETYEFTNVASYLKNATALGF